MIGGREKGFLTFRPLSSFLRHHYCHRRLSDKLVRGRNRRNLAVSLSLLRPFEPVCNCPLGYTPTVREPPYAQPREEKRDQSLPSAVIGPRAETLAEHLIHASAIAVAKISKN